MKYVLDMDNLSTRRKFDVERAAKELHGFVRPGENLLKANLVSYLVYIL